MGALSSLTGGGGLSASSSASTGPQKSGDIGGSTFSFGGINTGTQSTLPPWTIPALIIGGLILGAVYLFKRK